MSERFSDEYLNAYLDDELDAEEKRRLLSALRRDEALRARLCQLEQVRKMVSLAYSDVRLEDRATRRQPRLFNSGVRVAVAAGLLLTLGVLLGWVSHERINPGNPSLVSLSKQVRLHSRDIADTWKVLLHVTSDDPYRIDVLFNETERLLAQYRHAPEKISIEILANGKGLKMLRRDTSQFGQRIKKLQDTYANLAFYACGKAMERLKKEKGINIQLLPQVLTARSALSQSMKRQKEGWTYIKI